MTSSNSVDHVGFIGLGEMGLSVAAHIVRSGHRTLGWDRSPEAVTAFAEQGGIAVDGVAGFGAAGIVFSMVFDDAGTREITLGAGGLVQTLAPDATHVVMASISPELSRELSGAHAARGQHYVAAPVFGRLEAAAAAELLVLGSGSRRGFDRAERILKAVGDIRWVGADPEQAMLVKTMGNSMIYTAIESLREMFTLLRDCGIEEPAAKQLLVDTLFPGQIFESYAQRYIDNPAALHMSDIARKDRTNCVNAAAERGVDLPLIRFLHEHDLP